MNAPAPFDSPARYRALIDRRLDDELRLGMPVGPPARVGLSAAVLTVAVELMVKLVGGARTASALLRLAESIGRPRLRDTRS